MRIILASVVVLTRAACSSSGTASPVSDGPATTAAPAITTTAAPATTAAGPVLGRDTFLAVKNCVDAMAYTGSFAVEFDTTEDLDAGMEMCSDAADLLDADGIKGPIVEAILYRNVQASLLALKIGGGQATAADGDEFDAAHLEFSSEVDGLLDELNEK